jgi:hypothetical protein
LKAALGSRRAPGGVGAITSATRMGTVADAWMEADHGWSTGTRRTYRSVVNKQVKLAFDRLCIREVTPRVVSRALAAIAKSSGPGAAKTGRARASPGCSRWRSKTAPLQLIRFATPAPRSGQASGRRVH